MAILTKQPVGEKQIEKLFTLIRVFGDKFLYFHPFHPSTPIY